jgi:energy-coupling factor transporter ATP-binding protein EcfA2
LIYFYHNNTLHKKTISTFFETNGYISLPAVLGKNWHKYLFVEKYTVNIYDEDFGIDPITKRINLAKPFKFIETAYTDNANGEILLEFLFECVSNSDEDIYDSVMQVLSCVSHRQQSQIITWLYGHGGIGKSTFLNLVQALFGDAYSTMNESALNGNDLFNSSLLGSAVMSIEETSGKGEASYKQLARNLKNMATNKDLKIRRMYQDAFDVRNIVNIFICTNMVVDIFNDRRNLILEMGIGRKNDIQYFALINKCIEDKDALQYVFNAIRHNYVEPSKIKIVKTAIYDDIGEKNINNAVFQEFMYHEFVYTARDEKQLKANDIYKKFVNYCNLYVAEDKKKYLYEAVGKSLARTMFEQTGKKKDGYDMYIVEKEKVLLRLQHQLAVTSSQFENWHQIFETRNKTNDVSEASIEDISTVHVQLESAKKQLSEKDKIIEELRKELELYKKSNIQQVLTAPEAKKKSKSILETNTYMFE